MTENAAFLKYLDPLLRCHVFVSSIGLPLSYRACVLRPCPIMTTRTTVEEWHKAAEAPPSQPDLIARCLRTSSPHPRCLKAPAGLQDVTNVLFRCQGCLVGSHISRLPISLCSSTTDYKGDQGAICNLQRLNLSKLWGLNWEEEKKEISWFYEIMIRLLHSSIKLYLEGNGFNVEAYISVQVEFWFFVLLLI